ncbi:MAG: hypothetical protein NTW91_06545 [Verrucomicrobia bacterium]|nr:hypothetical protein [Verrucomicrobiota bacterium]
MSLLLGKARLVFSPERGGGAGSLCVEEEWITDVCLSGDGEDVSRGDLVTWSY